MTKILHIITGLDDGGAEGVLFRLVKADEHNQHCVVSLLDEGKYGPLLEALDVKVICLRMAKGRLSLNVFLKLWRICNEHKPDIVQTWMYHADLIGGVVARLAGVSRVYWNIRHSELVPGKSSRSTILVARVCAWLSHIVPRKIICCAERAVQVHVDAGYARSKFFVIGNGYDLNRFVPDEQAAGRIKNELKLYDVPVLGMVGRFNAQKDHRNLLNALSLLKARGVAFVCLLVGTGLKNDNEKICDWINRDGLTENVLLLGPRIDIDGVMNALDLKILSSSFGEAFPNVLAEAMACGTPCVTTDVGDAALIVGATGWVVRPQDPGQLADAIQYALNEMGNDPFAWEIRKQACRHRILENYSVQRMVALYHQAWTIDKE